MKFRTHAPEVYTHEPCNQCEHTRLPQRVYVKPVIDRQDLALRLVLVCEECGHINEWICEEV